MTGPETKLESNQPVIIPLGTHFYRLQKQKDRCYLYINEQAVLLAFSG